MHPSLVRKKIKDKHPSLLFHIVSLAKEKSFITIDDRFRPTPDDRWDLFKLARLLSIEKYLLFVKQPILTGYDKKATSTSLDF